MTCWRAPYFVLTLNFWPIHFFYQKCWRVDRLDDIQKLKFMPVLIFVKKRWRVDGHHILSWFSKFWAIHFFDQKCWRVDGFDCFKKSKFIPVLIFVKKRWRVDGYHILPYFSNFWAIHFLIKNVDMFAPKCPETNSRHNLHLFLPYQPIKADKKPKFSIFWSF